MPLEPGTQLGPYSVTAKIGEGGMGEVYRARDTKLDRDVVLKVLVSVAVAGLLVALGGCIAPEPSSGEFSATDEAALRDAAEQGDAEAQYRVGSTTFPYEAVQWFRLAADQGHAGAQFWLGIYHFHGLGVPEDAVEAHMWFNLAMASTSGETRSEYERARDEMASQLTAAERAEAQRRAGAWEPGQ